MVGWSSDEIRQGQLQDPNITPIMVQAEERSGRPEWSNISGSPSELKTFLHGYEKPMSGKLRWQLKKFEEMFFKTVSKCCVRPPEFARRRELKNYLAADTNSRLRVVCVWCTDEEEVFSRMLDLKQDVKQGRYILKLLMIYLWSSLERGMVSRMTLHPRD
ncbi:hypothetical protein CHS0354_000853 [Potamilus streckersoni]|uniref:Uncharacterized protein n=1 Tax=Potamilus streckersoni TaxID=2493646 RepID=A0AAE0VJJ2_9BIVA|nr:hypothetical protein CHS0354_000853 [Potamilus streckersoni]